MHTFVLGDWVVQLVFEEQWVKRRYDADGKSAKVQTLAVLPGTFKIIMGGQCSRMLVRVMEMAL